jgi:hypothetical protein
VTNTPTRTATHTPTATITNTPTATTAPNLCDQQSEGGAHAPKSSCTGPEDDFIVVQRKNTPGSLGFRGEGSIRPFDEFRDANDIKITSGQSPHILKNDFTLTAILDDLRTVQLGIPATFIPSLSTADIAGFGACMNDQVCQWGVLPQWTDKDVSPFAPVHLRCSGIQLDGLAHYCRITGGTAQFSRVETRAAYGCIPRQGAMTLYNGETETALPGSCALSAALTVNGADLTGFCAVGSAASQSIDGNCDDATEGWTLGDTRGLSFTSFGIGCSGSISAEVEFSCSGE